MLNIISIVFNLLAIIGNLIVIILILKHWNKDNQSKKAVLSAIRGEKRGDKAMNAKIIGERLLKLRGSNSREDVAQAVGVSVSAMSMYENGERIPRDKIKIRLADFYGQSVQEIFFNQKRHVM